MFKDVMFFDLMPYDTVYMACANEASGILRASCSTEVSKDVAWPIPSHATAQGDWLMA